jgi:FkbM family methyltransferase
MTLLDRVFSHESLRDDPPVLVDVGASGGSHPVWRRIARYSVGLGFEPDSRETKALSEAQRTFRRWCFCDKLVIADELATTAELHLTESPYCSSTLPPDEAALVSWAFAGLFATKEKRRLPAITLEAALREQGLRRIDWLKCDTQGTDLRIFQSLPTETRSQVSALEFEPGVIDAYVGEEKLHHVLAAMEAEPFWLCDLAVQQSPFGALSLLEARLGPRLARQYRRFGPGAAICANATYLHRVEGTPPLEIRRQLLLWVFAMELRQPAFACMVAETGIRSSGDPLFETLARVSTTSMRKAVWRAMAKRAWGKLIGAEW